MDDTHTHTHTHTHTYIYIYIYNIDIRCLYIDMHHKHLFKVGEPWVTPRHALERAAEHSLTANETPPFVSGFFFHVWPKPACIGK
jgi:hypothetical protein